MGQLSLLHQQQKGKSSAISQPERGRHHPNQIRRENMKDVKQRDRTTAAEAGFE